MSYANPSDYMSHLLSGAGQGGGGGEGGGAGAGAGAWGWVEMKYGLEKFW